MTADGEAAGAGDRSAGEAHRTSGQAAPMLEWMVGGIGAALVAGAVGFLVYHSLVRDQAPPDIRLVAERVVHLGDGYLVQFRAFNEGRSAAAEVTIEGEIVGPDGTTELGEAVFDYLPPRSDRKGGLLFEHDPRVGELRLRAKGYAEP